MKPTPTLNRARVDDFLRKLNIAMPRRCTRSDVWRVAGYSEATMFERWQRGATVSAGAASRFKHVLSLTPDEFRNRLKLVLVAGESSSPQFPCLSSGSILLTGEKTTMVGDMQVSKASPGVVVNLIFGGASKRRSRRGEHPLELADARALLNVILGNPALDGPPERPARAAEGSEDVNL